MLALLPFFAFNYLFSALFSANQNRVIFSCILLMRKKVLIMCRMQMLADLLICTTASCEMLCHGILEYQNFKIFPIKFVCLFVCRQGYPGTLLQAYLWTQTTSKFYFNQENVLRSRSIVVDAKPILFDTPMKTALCSKHCWLCPFLLCTSIMSEYCFSFWDIILIVKQKEYVLVWKLTYFSVNLIPGMTRDDLFNTNASIVQTLAEACAK